MNATTATPALNRIQRPALIVALAGLALAVAGAFFDREHFWRAYLLAYIFWLQIALGCLGWLMLHHLAGGRWSQQIRRLMEAGAMTLPLLALLFLPLLVGAAKLYPWMDPAHLLASPLLEQKRAYLNVPFFLMRAVLYFVVWLGLTYALTRWTTPQTVQDQDALALRMRRLSAIGMILLVLTATFAAYDWLMSLEPEWFSSIYGLLFIAGQGLAAVALAIIGLRLLPDPAAPGDWTQSFNDLGNFLLGFVMIWAYFSFSQFLIIWSANIGEEAIWYYRRSQGGWLNVGILLIGLHFALPFLLLLSRKVKRTARWLTILAVLILAARLIDLYWLIMPAFYPARLAIHWLDPVITIAMGGGWIALFIRQWQSRPALLYPAPHAGDDYERQEPFAAQPGGEPT